MKILAYKGKSVVSHLIKFQTRSQYSHIGIQLNDGSVIEAWQGEGVRRIGNPFVGHSKGTEVDVFKIIGDYDDSKVEAYLYDQIGKKYDYVNVLRFVWRRNAADNEKVFCSELAEMAFIQGGLRLLNGNPSVHSPRDTVMSPHLIYEKTLS